MTCIVGIEHAGGVMIGGDSAGVDQFGRLQTRADEKVFTTGEFVFGFSSSFRMGQLLRYKLIPPPFTEGADLETYLATGFVDAVRSVLKDGGYARRQREQEEGGQFLVGVRGRLFTVQDDYQVGRTVDGYAAVGCGADLALGALHATGGGVSPADRLTAALGAAARFSSAVAPPFTFADAAMPAAAAT